VISLIPATEVPYPPLLRAMDGPRIVEDLAYSSYMPSSLLYAIIGVVLYLPSPYILLVHALRFLPSPSIEITVSQPSSVPTYPNS
jgi:hypothetical protein